ncbi:hypothetical protein M0812_06449 [Anaeramoeba flamelloides]|uniref:Uncharacterized protein n=1 Tax=Anaeramoeba flamelloides TaxID=1746091 RepID=A0AAV8A7L9_9EUKA|nr:hypothetical protein M0812_06449 [Anaeramoeba flamelloides]
MQTFWTFLFILLCLSSFLSCENLETENGLKLVISERVEEVYSGDTQIGDWKETIKTGFSYLDHLSQPSSDTNYLENPSFEDVDPENSEQADHWKPLWSNGYSYETTGCKTGDRCVKLSASTTSEECAAYQQWKPASSLSESLYYIKISGWAKAESVSGEVDAGDFAFYMDIALTSGENQYGETLAFNTGTHDWEYMERIVTLEGEIESASIYCLLRDKTGTVWFDDLKIEPFERSQFELTEVVPRNSNTWTQTGESNDESSTLYLYATYETFDNYISVDVELEDPQLYEDQDRSVTLFWSLPVDATSDSYTWCFDPENEEEVGQGVYTRRNFDIGSATMSFYPYSSLGGSEHGISLAVPVDQGLFAFDFKYNARSSEYLVSFHVGLKKSHFDGSSNLHFIIYKFPNSQHKCRASMAFYYDYVYPDIFLKRIPEEQGIWMPFRKISDLEDWEDFGFKFYEGSSEPEFMNENNIYNYPYIENGLMHLSLPEGFELTDENVWNYIVECPNNASLSEATQDKCKQINSSGIYDENLHLQWQEEKRDWNDGAKFLVNSNEDIPKEFYPVNRGMRMYETVEKFYQDASDNNYKISGVYVDSLECFSKNLNYRPSHFNVEKVTLITDENHKAAFFGQQHSYTFSKILAETVRNKSEDQSLMANGVLFRFSQFAAWYDVFGTETTWLRDGTYTNLAHYYMTFYRSIAYKKPYLFLQNSDFSDNWTKDTTQRYFDYSFHYGIFPGFFSPEASSNSHYFDHPEYYNRDRPLFKWYIPKIKLIAESGWMPITLSTIEFVSTVSDTTSSYIERWGPKGDGENIYYTFRVEDSETPDTINDIQITFHSDLDILSIPDQTITWYLTYYDLEISSTEKLSNDKFSIALDIKTETTYLLQIVYSNDSSDDDDDDDDIVSGTESFYSFSLLLLILLNLFIFF